MKDYIFRSKIDNVLRNMISESLNLLSYERGPDFRTKDFKYSIEMKSRRIEKEDQKTHFSIKTRQYQNFIKSIQQSVFPLNDDYQPITKPNLIFIFLKYRTKIPVSEIPSEFFIKENLELDSAYLVDQKILRKFETSNKFMNITIKELNNIVDEFGIEPMVIKRLNFPVLPIGKNSKTLLGHYF